MEISQERSQPKPDVGLEEEAGTQSGCEPDRNGRPVFLPEDSSINASDAFDSSPESTISLLESDNKEWSDCSISDDESLIEIELPGGNHLEEDRYIWEKDFPVVEMPEYAFQKRGVPAFEMPESIFRRQILMELSSELIEEDNLIEIDISAGSIKCPSVEIEA